MIDNLKKLEWHYLTKMRDKEQEIALLKEKLRLIQELETESEKISQNVGADASVTETVSETALVPLVTVSLN